MDFRQSPVIEAFSPRGDAVALDTVIEVQMSIDLDRSALPGSVLVIDPQGHQVPGDLSYAARMLRFVPKEPLAPGAAYTVVVKGIPTADKSGVVQSVVGIPMGDSASFGFVTSSTETVRAPVLLSPADGVEINEVSFYWQPVEKASSYALQVYQDPSLQQLVFEAQTTEPQLTPVHVSEKQYWWRVAGADATGQLGPFSPVRTFLYTVRPTQMPVPIQAVPTFYYHQRVIGKTITDLTVGFSAPVEIQSVTLIREDQTGAESDVATTHTWAGNLLKIAPQTVAEGRYQLVVLLQGGQEIAYTFLYAPSLYAKPRHVREELGDVAAHLTDEQVGLSIWQLMQEVDEQMVLVGVTNRDHARSRYTAFLSAVSLLRRRLIELASLPSEEEKKLGDGSIRVRRDYRVLDKLLIQLETELSRWYSALMGGTQIKSAVRGGTTTPYPLTGRVW